METGRLHHVLTGYRFHNIFFRNLHTISVLMKYVVKVYTSGWGPTPKSRSGRRANKGASLVGCAVRAYAPINYQVDSSGYPYVCQLK